MLYKGQTMEDYQRIVDTELELMEDAKVRLNWNYETDQEHYDEYYVFYIVSSFENIIITFNENNGALHLDRISRTNLNKLNNLRQTL